MYGLRAGPQGLWELFSRDGPLRTRVACLMTRQAVSDLSTPASSTANMQFQKLATSLAQISNREGLVAPVVAFPDASPGFPAVGVAYATSAMDPDGLLYCDAPGTDVGCGVMVARTDISVESFLVARGSIGSACTNSGITRVSGTAKPFFSDIDFLSDSLRNQTRFVKNICPAISAPPMSQVLWDGHPASLDGGSFACAQDEDFWETSGAKHAMRTLGTTGPGNHYVEFFAQHASPKAELDPRADIWVAVHTGSRTFGESLHAWVTRYVRAEKHGLARPLPTGSAAVIAKSPTGQLYGTSMAQCCNIARINRLAVLQRAMESASSVLGIAHTAKLIRDTPHNYISIEERRDQAGQHVQFYMHRKGVSRATPSGAQEYLVDTAGYELMNNQNDPVFIGASFGAESLLVAPTVSPLIPEICSLPHGTGRAMSCTQAERTFTSTTPQRLQSKWCMEPVYDIPQGIIAEHSLAYRAPEPLAEWLSDTGFGTVVSWCHPLLPLKGGGRSQGLED